MKIQYFDEHVQPASGDYWSEGPVVKFFKDAIWLIAASGRPVLVGKRWRSTDNIFYQIVSELEPGQRVLLNENGEAYVQ